ncbi:hypothetical protein CEF21_06735 [Bacillus sp. FJAT-42376]|uniref:hypothetical protein n=1 Tax=Bacillus sp. FJAT-42376 TaxID=2014076 RepID=UPI000F4F5871|nr:hypothetical protein [Bacillus sp. FJAT-42376]AZB42014.1 hypothetical protein CEF21_06735 [Bacillus sp. FJAT-42376]
MKRWSVVVGLLAFLLSTNGNIARAEDYFENGTGEVPAEAKIYADTNFLNDVKQVINRDTPSNYNLTGDGNITFGPLFSTFAFSRSFKESREMDKDASGMIQKNEWISVVYQNGNPVNVIGTFKKDDGQFTMSTFGYGKDFAEMLAKFTPDKNKKIIYEMPIDAWYMVDLKIVKALNDSAKTMITKDMTINQFQDRFIQRYKDANPILDKNGSDVSVGGSGTTSNVINEKNNSINPLVLYGGIALVLSLGGSALIIFVTKRKRNDTMVG